MKQNYISIPAKQENFRFLRKEEEFRNVKSLKVYSKLRKFTFFELYTNNNRKISDNFWPVRPVNEGV